MQTNGVVINMVDYDDFNKEAFLVAWMTMVYERNEYYSKLILILTSFNDLDIPIRCRIMVGECFTSDDVCLKAIKKEGDNIYDKIKADLSMFREVRSGVIDAFSNTTFYSKGPKLEGS